MITVSRRKISISPQKLRLTANLIRGKRVDQATLILSNLPGRSSYEMVKLLKAGIDAGLIAGYKREDLKIANIRVDEGARLKRFKPSARGRSSRIIHRKSHLTLSLESKEASKANSLKK